MKHAYLIMAHGDMAVLDILLSCIDDARNDIYLHVDSKDAIPKFSPLRYSRLFVIKERIDVRWGDLSQIETELALFRAAVNAPEPYSYYHLLSGADLPIKDQDYIHDFFRANAGKEFIGYAEFSMTDEIVRKVQRWHLYPKHFKSASFFIRLIRRVFIRFQELFGIKRNKGIQFKKGDNWVSITDGMARLFLSKEQWIRKTFTHTFCGDEVVMQTICWNSIFKESLYNLQDEWAGNQRIIGWQNGELIDWTANDYEKLKNSSALFARKFNTEDPEFLLKIVELSKK